MKIAILGGGSWGAALAIHLSKKNHRIKVWEFFEEQAKEMQEKRFCKLLPEVNLAPNIFVSHKIEEVLLDIQLVLLVVPSDKVEATIKMAKPMLGNQPIVICSKGLGSNMRLLSEIVKENVSGPVFCLYGPTHAEEVCKGLFSGIVLAGGARKKKIKTAIESQDLRVELSNDIIGVQVCSALKNILAVFVGVIDGMKLGDNAKAYIMTKGLEEIKEVGLKWGAKKDTFYGLAGIGDIIVTCTSKHSRNHHVGEEVGKGRKLDEVLAEMKMVAEGITTLKNVPELKQKFGLELPLMTEIYQIILQNKDPKDVLKEI